MAERRRDTGERRTRTRAEREHERRYRRLRRELARGNMSLLLDAYLASCAERSAEDGIEEGAAKGRRTKQRARGALPNPAGFCRYYGISRDAYGRLESEFPTEVGRMRAVFEDEALNSELPATVLGFYLKDLLGAVHEREDGERSMGGEQLHVTFEHDILSDGR